MFARCARSRRPHPGLTLLALPLLVLMADQAGVAQRQSARAFLFGVGDIVNCTDPASADLTGRLMSDLLRTTRDSVGVTFGDNSNDDGSEADYSCFDGSSWGRLMPQLQPTPGNHDYRADSVLPFYFLYFPNSGAPGRGYRAFDVGAWRVYALNSELMSNRELRHAQLTWLEEDLSAHARTQCTLAYFHRPPFSSGQFASPAWVMPIFRKLYKHGVDVVATGHEHFFAALPPLTPEGVVDRAYGIPILIAGTGGAVMFRRPARIRYAADGEVVVTQTLGVLKLTLDQDSFAWAFVPVHAGAPAPSGFGRCHENPAGYQD